MLLNLPNLVETTVPANTVVFGTTLGLANGMYPSLNRPSPSQQAAIQAAIWKVKNGDLSYAGEIQRIASTYDYVLAGCTEIPLLLGDIPYFDPAVIANNSINGAVLVIGGMGVQAGKSFARAMGTHLHTDNPHPCRIAALSGSGPSPAHSIATTIKEQWAILGRIKTVLACNTAYLFQNEINSTLRGAV